MLRIVAAATLAAFSVAAALKRPEVLEALKKQAFVPISSSPDAFGAYLRQQLEIWGKTIRDAGIQPE